MKFCCKVVKLIFFQQFDFKLCDLPLSEGQFFLNMLFIAIIAAVKPTKKSTFMLETGLYASE
jgi:hypothetical protein